MSDRHLTIVFCIILYLIVVAVMFDWANCTTATPC